MWQLNMNHCTVGWVITGHLLFTPVMRRLSRNTSPPLYLKSNLDWHFETRAKNYFRFCLFRAKTIFPRENLAGLRPFTHPGALEICLFRAEFLIHKIASHNVHRGYFSDIILLTLKIIWYLWESSSKFMPQNHLSTFNYNNLLFILKESKEKWKI